MLHELIPTWNEKENESTITDKDMEEYMGEYKKALGSLKNTVEEKESKQNNNKKTGRIECD